MSTKYRVLRMFDDLTDYTETKGGLVMHRYNPGDVYPREGKSTTPERVAELAGAGNRQGVPLIVPVDEPTTAPEISATAAQGGESAPETVKHTAEPEKALKTASRATKRKPAGKSTAKAAPKKRVQ